MDRTTAALEDVPERFKKIFSKKYCLIFKKMCSSRMHGLHRERIGVAKLSGATQGKHFLVLLDKETY